MKLIASTLFCKGNMRSLFRGCNHVSCQSAVGNNKKYYFVPQYQQYFHTHSLLNNIFSSQSKNEFITRVKNLHFDKFSARKTSVIEKKASVMVPLCTVMDQPSVLFTVRSPRMGRNKNDVSFPGGMVESDDPDYISTALREMEEEIGISPSSVDIWTTLFSVPSRNNEILITPVVGYVGQIDPMNCKFNEEEVDVVFTETLSTLCNPKNRLYTIYKTRRIYGLPTFIAGEYRIWGVTAVILHIVLEALIPHSYTNEKLTKDIPKISKYSVYQSAKS